MCFQLFFTFFAPDSLYKVPPEIRNLSDGNFQMRDDMNMTCFVKILEMTTSLV